jgi:hypothetical protein
MLPSGIFLSHLQATKVKSFLSTIDWNSVLDTWLHPTAATKSWERQTNKNDAAIISCINAINFF